MFLDHYSAGKVAGVNKEAVAAICGRCKRATVEAVEHGNSTHTANFILRRVCEPLIPQRLISDHGSAISLGTVPHLLETINSGLSNYYHLQDHRKGSNEAKHLENLENAHMLMKWKEANAHKYDDKQRLNEKMDFLKKSIEEGRIRTERAERAKTQKDRWKHIHHNSDVRKIEHMKSSCLLYTSPSPRDRTRSRMPSSA